MDPEKFNNIASGIQSLVIAVAVVIGGFWAIYRFASLKEIEKAKAGLEEMRRGLRERGILDINIQEKEIARVEGTVYHVRVDVTIHNTGNRSEVIDWSKSGAYVTKVEAGTESHLSFGQTSAAQYLMPGHDVPASSILPGQTRQMPFLFSLRSRGVYHLMFKATVSPLEETVHAQEHHAAGVEAEQYVWESSTYFSVE